MGEENGIACIMNVCMDYNCISNFVRSHGSEFYNDWFYMKETSNINGAIATLHANYNDSKFFRCGIEINIVRWRTFDNKMQQAFLLHEIGHLKSDLPKLKKLKVSTGHKEYLAQKWAIEYAYGFLPSLHAKSVYLLNNWQKCDWREQRIYRMAYKLALKDRKWARKMGLIM